ncbi:PREDICTED: zinc-finger homeodomain protein 6 isoform X2 [Ipomoea nil]|uniref:zinc-finger homeodomain protein 6 isoform X2 n=1 Tax=Ipomoea nil TaxID=35883 RepID=UPI0009011497|nr:PREDICTED: zinc-finger homeodomain protein 6 isoform X2 [Ipomoea nil]
MEVRGSSQQQKDMRILQNSIGGGYPSSLDRRNNGLIIENHHPMQTLDQLHLAQDDEAANPDPDPGVLPAGPGNSAAVAAPPQVLPETSANGSGNSVRYKACLKNHAASMGGHVIDGCGEFMPSGEDGTPDALKCAACDCHRNFHRKEIDGEAPPPPYFPFTPAINNHHHRVHTPHSAPVAMPPRNLHHYSHGLQVPPVMMAFGGGAPAESSSEDLNLFNHARGQVLHNPSPFSVSRKRFRTKFTQQQKDSMHEFAEKLGWKIQKQDEQQVLQFCSEMGIKRQVFKVWMHNNKQNFKKPQM